MIDAVVCTIKGRSDFRVSTTIVCYLCALSWFLALPTFAVESYKRLAAEEFKRQFVGHTVGDNAHWSYRFTADGGLEAVDLGKVKRGTWRFSRGELCLDGVQRGKSVSECFEVWYTAGKVRFLRDGVLMVEGWLLDT
jgi:hypothetical protein